MGENNVEELIAFGPIFIAPRRISLGLGMGVIINHFAVILVDILKDTQQIGLAYNGEIIGMFGGVSGRVVLNYPTVLVAQGATGLVRIACHHVRHHLIVDCSRDTNDKTFFNYHNNFASRSSSS